METMFHPVSGETVYMASAREKEIIDIALLLLRKESDKNE